MELSGQFPIRLLCTKTGIPRSSFYNWKKSVEHPPEQKKRLVQSIGLFQEYHGRFPSHGYRWLNAKIRLDKGIVFSDPYAHKCCKIAGIKSLCKHYSYKKEGDPSRTYPNLLLAGINITGPMECVVSDMTAFYVERTYYELTLYMDLWNDELIAHALSSKRGDRMTYLDGLHSRSSIRIRSSSCTAIKALFTHPRATTNSCPCTTLSGQCPEPAHRQTMPRWRRLMVGSRPNSLQISILLRRRMSPLRYPTTSASSTRSALHMPLDTLRRSSIGSSSRQSTKVRLLDTCPLNGGHGYSVYHIFDEYVQYLSSND